MSVFDLLKENILQTPAKSIVFPEATDERILTASSKLAKASLVKPILLGNAEAIAAKAAQAGVSLDGCEVIDPETYAAKDQLVKALMQRRAGKVDEKEASDLLKHNNYFGAMLVYTKLADGMVSGAAHSTADTVRPALQIIKAQTGMKRVSGSFIMEKDQQRYIFADCAINVNPDATGLAEIAYQSALTAKMIGLVPKIAFLSFSTFGSAKGEMVDKVKEAAEIFKQDHPDILADGEIQFDAAFVPDVAQAKAPSSALKGQANVFIFPNLEAGNIAYKMVQRLGEFTAVGPILQGLAAPINDLSRGCSSQDVYQMAILTAAQAGQGEK